MASKVEICNMALISIGANTIMSFADGTREADICNTLYNSNAEYVMSQGPWSSCLFRAKLNQLVDKPLYGFSYQYELPTNPKLLRLAEINGALINDVKYAKEGDRLLIDEESVECTYIGIQSDTSKYGPYLQEVIISRLRYILMFPITGSMNSSSQLYQEYTILLDKNLLLDRQQSSASSIQSYTLTKVR